MEQTLEIRQTQKFVGAYKYLDNWLPIGRYLIEAKSEPIINADDPEDPCEPTKQSFFVRTYADKGAQPNDIEQALKDCFGSWGCGHEYDCCGCWSTAVINVEQLNKNYWRVETLSTRNF